MTELLVIFPLSTALLFFWMWSDSVKRQKRKSVNAESVRQLVANGFFASPEYDLIRRFAAKFPDGSYTDRDIASLHDFLSTKWFVPGIEIRRLVDIEVKNSEDDACRRYLKSGEDRTRNAYITRYLDRYNLDDQRYMHVLYEVIRGAGHLKESERDPRDLQREVVALAREIEFSRFRNRLFEDADTPWSDIDDMDGAEFEVLVGRLMAKMGYEVAATPVTGDQGSDIVATKFGETVVIQVKRWSARVGNSAVQEAVAAIKYYRAQRAMVVTSGSFTRAAIALAKANNVELVDREKLMEWVESYW